MRPEQEQELAYILMVELLAYQFASPVRWIETQDVILQEKAAERLVEIGPSDTLGGMARRTLAAKYESYDAALSLQRQILCYNKDVKEIYYDVDPQPEEPEASAAPSASAPVTSAAPTSAAPVTSAPSAGPAAQISDEPVKATDVVRAIVAQKLKKNMTDVPLNMAIKDLVNGKSTLQNEMLGDLGKEFGSAPEKAEDTPLDELSAAFQATYNGQLGKQSSSLIAKMISSKMPGGFNITSARKYLENTYGLGPGRQDGVLLLSITSEPAARLGGEADAKAFFDGMANKYASYAGISLSAGAASGGGGGGQGGGMMMDPAAIDALTKDQRTLFKQQLELLARYLKVDLKAGDKAHIVSVESQKVLQAQLDLWNTEHGEFYASGIEPSFSPLKARVYDSHWNWARQDAMTMYYDIIFGRLKLVDREIVSQCIRIMNRSNPVLLEFMQYHIDHCPTERGETYRLAKQLGMQLIENCKEVLTTNPVFKDVGIPLAPQTTMDAKGNLKYEEVPRPAVRKLELYVKEMAAGGKISEYGTRTKVQNDLQRIYKIIKQEHRMSKSSHLNIKTLYAGVIRSLGMNESQILEGKKNKKLGLKSNGIIPNPDQKTECIPFLHLKRQSEHGWEYSKKLTGLYLDCLEQTAKSGVTFHGKTALMTGAGAGSIGAEVLQGLITGGARVLVTTSRFSKEVTEYYQSMYARHGAKGSQLVVVPFNQGSKQDVEALVEYIYDSKNGLGWDLDYVLPFAAISENGREISDIDSKSELAHRIMLTNILRLLGMVKTLKQRHGYETRPAQVILPLSENHGTFGNDGMYSESKLALETLFNRWHSESWGHYLTICGAIIGWTRGTGLMSPNNIIAEGLEKLGVRTFSQQEMAFNILGLMDPAVADFCQSEPIYADLNGGLQFIRNLKERMGQLRRDLMETAEIRKVVSTENAIENKTVNGEKSEGLYQKVPIQPRANLKFPFPTLPDYKTVIEPLSVNLKGMLDLERVVVVTGFAEVGPWGNSRTRWEMEAYGEFSLEGCVEMAWIMGLIKHHNGPIKGKQYAGWVDAKTGEPVEDKDVKAKYEKYILEHSGIRLIEPELFGGYDPKKKELLQEVVIGEDLEQFEASKESAEEFKRHHGENVDIFEIPETGEYTVRLKKGATLLIPKALRFDRLVAGQIPTGWDARRYGVPEDIISQVDPVTLYLLTTVAQALVSAGVTDPYEFYKYVHISEVGNCVGSGVGGMTALRGMYKDRWTDKPVQKDILQESFINTMSAWVNMLLLSSTGPIKTPVGACATAIESLEIGVETILDGKARICLVGGFDDFQEEGSYEFANMKATSNADDEFAQGRSPSEMSRPTTTTRNGFMESQGCGVQLIMSAKLALEMGVPIYGIVAMTSTATDKIGRSIPAPGQGILTTAREAYSKFPSPLLDIKYRRRQLELRKLQIKQWTEAEYLYLQEAVAAMKSEQPDFEEQEYMQDRAAHIERESARQEREALNTWGNDFYRQDPKIAPIRGALATWGLTIDDIGVASFHGTSTKANDKNESDAVNKMLKHLGRKKGNALLGIFQKYLTGHPKGAAGAWQMNGALQVLQSGLVPGNRNADNIDEKLEAFEHIVYPNKSIQTDGVRAFSVTSFGFGQKGAQAIGVHSNYLFATLDEQTYEAYKTKVNARQKKAYRYMHNSLVHNNLFQAKTDPPYTGDQEVSTFLNPHARVQPDKKTNSFSYPQKPAQKPADPSTEHTRKIVEQLAHATKSEGSKIGVDVELISSLNIDNDTFIERNFTQAEIDYCRKAASPQASFSGRWSAKEAVFKSLGVASQGGGAPLKCIEILSDEKGAPIVELHGDALQAATEAGVKTVQVSISHSDVQAIAIAVSTF
ncbi:fatty acid synthase-like protein [Peziza echinospora]|nr:fatty acid synthase-like protein [Peziza echinospora]